MREARAERYLQLCVAPTPKNLMKFSTKFDATYEENLALYQVGYKQGESWLSSELDNHENPVSAMDRWYAENTGSGL